MLIRPLLVALSLLSILLLPACGKDSARKPAAGSGGDARISFIAPEFLPEGQAFSVTAQADGSLGVIAWAWDDSRGSVRPLQVNRTGNRFDAVAPWVGKDENIVLQVTVSDASGVLATQTLTLRVADTDPARGSAPVVVVAPASQEVDEGREVGLSATVTAAEGKAIQHLRWRQLADDAVRATLPDDLEGDQLRFTAPQVSRDEVLHFQLVATDSAGESAAATASVRVRDILANRLPVARAGDSRVIEVPSPGPITVSLDGCASSDEDGSIAGWLWQELDAGGDVIATLGDTCLQTVTVASEAAGRIRSFRLTVTDNAGASASDTVSLVIAADTRNTRPLLTDAGATPQPARPGESVLLQAVAEDAEGHPVSYRWQQVGDGQHLAIRNSDAATAEILIPADAGGTDYQFRVSVRDGGTLEADADSRVVSVQVRAAQPSREPGLSECLRNPTQRGCLLSPLNALFSLDSYEACFDDPTQSPCLLSGLARFGVNLASCLGDIGNCNATQLINRGPITSTLDLLPAVDSAGSCNPDYHSAYGQYWGSLHEHTAYSDGAAHTRPADVMARVASRGFDFVGVTDHSDNARLPIALPDFDNCTNGNPLGCLLSDPERLTDNLRKWQATQDQVLAATSAQFTPFRGFEWTSDRFGHANVLFSQHLVNAKTGPGYLLSMELFWQWFMYPARLGGGNDGLLSFNHPGREDTFHAPLESIGFGDPAYVFNDFRYVPGADYRVVGVEVFGKSSEYDTGGAKGSWFAYALDKGWYLAPIGSEDHHDKRWGDADLPKTVLIARTRGRADLKEAMLARRMYAVAQHYNELALSFSATQDGRQQPMGSRVVSPDGELALDFRVGARPGHTLPLKGDAIVELMSSQADNRAQYQALASRQGLSGSFSVPVRAQNDWHFLRVRDSGDNNRVVAVSAPIWTRSGQQPLPACPAL